MADYVCPEYIYRLFLEESTRDQAKLLAAGDLVWLPDVGWCVNRGDGESDKGPYRITMH